MKILFLFALFGAAVAQGFGGGWIGQGGIGGGWEGAGIGGHWMGHKFPPAPLAHDGRVIDTPEVAHAKMEHFKAHAAAKHGQIGGGQIGFGGGQFGIGGGQFGIGGGQIGIGGGQFGIGGGQYGIGGGEYGIGHGKWHGPIAHIELTHDGKFVKETPEVAHARAQHLAAVAAIGHKGFGGPGIYGGIGIQGGYGAGFGGGEMTGQYHGEGEEMGQYKGEGLAESMFQGEVGGYGKK